MIRSGDDGRSAPHRISVLLGAAATLAALSVEAVAAKPQVEFLEDGSELVFVRLPGAPNVSLRYVVRAGGAADPIEMAGLAHFLEHVVFHGSYDVSEGELFAAVRTGGGRINAFTTPDHTKYELDIGRDQFEEVAGAYLRIITSPALTMAELERERGVILTESLLFSQRGMLWVADQFLFPGSKRGMTLIGTERTRRQIRNEHLVDFYEKHYIPSNTSVVVVGDLELSAVRALLQTAMRLPPEAPNDRVLRERITANVPIAEKTRAPITVTMFGYQLVDVDRSACDDLAGLLELRLMKAVQIERPLVSGLSAICHRLRGQDFLLALALSKSYEGAVLPEVMERTFAGAVTTPPTAEERRLVQARAKRRLARYGRDAAALADALATEAALPRGYRERTNVHQVMRSPRLEARALMKAARRSFSSERRILIHLSPFEG